MGVGFSQGGAVYCQVSAMNGYEPWPDVLELLTKKVCAYDDSLQSIETQTLQSTESTEFSGKQHCEIGSWTLGSHQCVSNVILHM